MIAMCSCMHGNVLRTSKRLLTLIAMSGRQVEHRTLSHSVLAQMFRARTSEKLLGAPQTCSSCTCRQCAKL